MLALLLEKYEYEGAEGAGDAQEIRLAEASEVLSLLALLVQKYLLYLSCASDQLRLPRQPSKSTNIDAFLVQMYKY